MVMYNQHLIYCSESALPQAPFLDFVLKSRRYCIFPQCSKGLNLFLKILLPWETWLRLLILGSKCARNVCSLPPLSSVLGQACFPFPLLVFWCWHKLALQW